MSWHPEVLLSGAAELAAALGRLPEMKRFYLAGGTALALRLGHRKSKDFDFFSAEFAKGEAGTLPIKDLLSGMPGFQVRSEGDGTLHTVIGGIETSFLRYPYPLLAPTQDWQGLAVASIEDIGLMKIGAIIGRGSRRDFRDLREICREIGLAKLLPMGKMKFPDSEDFLFQAARALAYFDDAETEPDPAPLKPEPWRAVRRYFEIEAPAAFRRLLESGS